MHQLYGFKLNCLVLISSRQHIRRRTTSTTFPHIVPSKLRQFRNQIASMPRLSALLDNFLSRSQSNKHKLSSAGTEPNESQHALSPNSVALCERYRAVDLDQLLLTEGYNHTRSVLLLDEGIDFRRPRYSRRSGRREVIHSFMYPLSVLRSGMSRFTIGRCSCCYCSFKKRRSKII